MPIKNQLFYFVITAMLMGCAVGPSFKDAIKDVPPIAPGKGRIFVYRDVNPLMVFIQRTFTLDGKDLADIFHGTSIYYDTTPGPHYVTYNNPKELLKFDVPLGNSVYLKYSFGGSSTDGDKATEVQIVPKDKAIQEMEKGMLVETKIRTFIPKN